MIDQTDQILHLLAKPSGASVCCLSGLVNWFGNCGLHDPRLVGFLLCVGSCHGHDFISSPRLKEDPVSDGHNFGTLQI